LLIKPFNRSNSKVVTIFTALQNHQVADMMHDCDPCLRCRTACDGATLRPRKKRKPNCRSIAPCFKRPWPTTGARSLHGRGSELQRVEAPLANYLRLAEAFSAYAAKGNQAVAESDAALPGFNVSFRELEGAMSSVSEALEAEAIRMHAASLATVHRAGPPMPPRKQPSESTIACWRN
jgi:hypothetical protein